jgi:hypothetical protein
MQRLTRGVNNWVVSYRVTLDSDLFIGKDEVFQNRSDPLRGRPYGISVLSKFSGFKALSVPMKKLGLTKKQEDIARRINLLRCQF